MGRGRALRKTELVFEGGVTLDDLRYLVEQTADEASNARVTWQNMGTQLEGTSWKFTIESP